MAAFLSGEMKDTVQMNPAGAYGQFIGLSFLLRLSLMKSAVLERFFSRKERKRLFLSWAGSASMWMKVRPQSAPTLRLVPNVNPNGLFLLGRGRNLGKFDSRARRC